MNATLPIHDTAKARPSPKGGEPLCHINPDWLNIESVVENDLCTQCGACAAMCPHDTIDLTRDEHYRYFPKVKDESLCVNKCKSLCVQVCAGVQEDPSLWERNPIVAETYEEYCGGAITDTWIGYSTDDAIRSRGTSGGLVTGLLVYLLESGQIDGALLVGSNKKDPMQHDILIARTREEIEDAWGSKYYPMPIGERFRELVSSTERFAVVLLGCHMRSLRLMERKLPRLEMSIVLRIGLICGYCAGFKAIVDQARDWDIDLKTNERIDYREGKWPGHVRIQGQDKVERKLIYEFLPRIPFTTNYRCTICSDLMNETADVVVGDAWLKELTDRKDEGWSVIAARNRKVVPLIESAIRDGALYLEPADSETFVRSQEKPMRYKKHALTTRLKFASKVMGKTLPNVDLSRYPDGFETNFWNRLGNRLFMTTMWTFALNDPLRRAMYRFVPNATVQWWVRSIFLMIAHDGRGSFLSKWLLKKEPMLNCDA
jgi:coenzyme F420 hydrogenase subunit beta